MMAFFVAIFAFNFFGEGVPELALHDGGPAPVPGEDFAAYAGLNISDGEAAGKVRFIGLGDPAPSARGGWRTSYPDLERVDYTGEILLAINDENGYILSLRAPHDGLLVVSDEPAEMQKNHTLTGRSGKDWNWVTGETSGEETPALWISEEMGNRLLVETGYTVDELRDQVDALSFEEVMEIPPDNRSRDGG